MRKLEDYSELQEKAAFVLSRLMPDRSEQYADVAAQRFEAWRATPDMALHAGIFKVVSEVLIRARFPNGPNSRFINRRNVILDHLDREFATLQDLDEVNDGRWRRVSNEVEALLESCNVPNQSKDPTA